MEKQKIILDLCGGTGSWSKPWKDAGYRVINITLPEWDVTLRTENEKEIIFFDTKIERKIVVKREDIFGILAAPPCTMFSLARTKAKTPRDLKEGMKCVRACLDIIWGCREIKQDTRLKKLPLKFWALENPYSGMLKNFLGKHAFIFDPWEFGDGYQKKTAIWGDFIEPNKKPISMTDEVKKNTKGNRVMMLTKFDYLKSKDIHPEAFGKLTRQERRSITPAGFAKAFFKANRGSATDAEAVKKAVGGSSIRQILTDPPYGVAYVENKAHFKETIGANLANTTVIQGDQLQTHEQYAKFTADWLSPAIEHLDSYNTVYIFNSDVMLCALRRGMEMADIYYSQLIIWVKNTIVVGRKDYLPGHEVIAYGWHGRHKMERSKAKSVIFYPKPHRSNLHPTMKPVGLLRKLIENSTKIKETVYDPFGGSGSTLIACEQFKRKCVMIELDPNYCSTIIQRWELLTGKEAVKL